MYLRYNSETECWEGNLKIDDNIGSDYWLDGLRVVGIKSGLWKIDYITFKDNEYNSINVYKSNLYNCSDIQDLSARDFIVKNIDETVLPFKGNIDEPTNNATVKDSIKVRAWSVYDKKISKVEVLVYGKVQGTAKRRVRNDVGKIYSDYDVSEAGFEYQLDTKNLSNGSNKIEVRSTGEDGKINVMSRDIKVKNLESG